MSSSATAPHRASPSYPRPTPVAHLTGLPVRVENVRLSLTGPAGRVDILKEVSLTIPAGQRLGLVGPSGSGKTSLMTVLGGLERPTSGRIQVGARTLTDLDEDGLALFRRDHVGIIFQNFHLIPTMTALENVALPLELAGADGAWDRAAEQLRAVGLGHRLDHYPGQMSGGEQQRVAISRAFAARPALLLADEPTGNLDGETGEQIVRLMFDLTAHHATTLVLITHDPALAARCDRVVRLADGRLVGDSLPPPAQADAVP